jgi:hypothetical protein
MVKVSASIKAEAIRLQDSGAADPVVVAIQTRLRELGLAIGIDGVYYVNDTDDAVPTNHLVCMVRTDVRAKHGFEFVRPKVLDYMIRCVLEHHSVHFRPE